jgi:hypothetical protein
MFVPHNFRTRYPCEMSCYFGPYYELCVCAFALFDCRVFVLMVECKEVEGWGRLSVQVGAVNVDG